MSQSEKNDKLKVVGLVIGVVVIFGFFARTLMSQGGSDAPAETPVSPTTEVTAVASNATPSTTQEPGVIVVPSFPASVSTNPFRTYGPDVGFSPPPTMVQGPPPDTLPWPDGGENPVVPSPADILATMVLKGVIAGQRPVAVIQLGSVAYIVGRGELVGEDLLVESIRRHDVSLTDVRNGKSLTLKF